MNKIDFYQITDGQTGAQVASGLDDNFNAIEAALNEVEAGAQLKNPIQMDPNSGIINSEEDYNINFVIDNGSGCKWMRQ